MQRLDIAIVGCGPAGLATALLLHRDGHRVILFDQFYAPRPVGSGLMIQPTGYAVLRALGLADALLDHGRIERLRGEAGSSGRVVLDVRYAALGKRAGFGVGIHRATLFALLHDAVAAEGIPRARTVQRPQPCRCRRRRGAGDAGWRFLADRVARAGHHDRLRTDSRRRAARLVAWCRRHRDVRSDAGCGCARRRHRPGLGPHRCLAHAHGIGSFIEGNVDTGSRATDDVQGHGTHVAGTIGGRPVTPGEYGGIAPGVDLFAARVFAPGKLASNADIANAIDALSRGHGVDLINTRHPGLAAVPRDASRAALCRSLLVAALQDVGLASRYQGRGIAFVS